jgi:hypothetical protein
MTFERIFVPVLMTTIVLMTTCDFLYCWPGFIPLASMIFLASAERR